MASPAKKRGALSDLLRAQSGGSEAGLGGAQATASGSSASTPAAAPTSMPQRVPQQRPPTHPSYGAGGAGVALHSPPTAPSPPTYSPYTHGSDAFLEALGSGQGSGHGGGSHFFHGSLREVSYAWRLGPAWLLHADQVCERESAPMDAGWAQCVPGPRFDLHMMRCLVTSID